MGVMEGVGVMVGEDVGGPTGEFVAEGVAVAVSVSLGMGNGVWLVVAVGAIAWAAAGALNKTGTIPRM